MFKVTFHNQGKVYELFCEAVEGSGLSYGFMALSKLSFADNTVVIDPTEERMREEFADVEVLHLPNHAVIRVEQVKQRGACVIRDRESGEKVMPFPMDRPRRT
jgi:hypothetical protein